MNRVLLVGLLLSLCSCRDRSEVAFPKPGNDTPIIDAQVATPENDHQTESSATNKTTSKKPVDSAIVRSPVGSVLLQEGFEFVRLMIPKRGSSPFLNCVANGKPICFLVDTGATASCISQEIAKELKLQVKDSPGKAAATGNQLFSLQVSTIEQFKIAVLPATQLEVAVLDLSAAKKAVKEFYGIAFDGILGLPWLSKHACIVDFSNNALYYRFPGHYGPAPRGDTNSLGSNLLRNGYQFIPLDRCRNTTGRYVNCLANDKWILLAVDSGSDLVGISEDTVKQLQLPVIEAPGKTVASVGSTVHKTKRTSIDRFVVGELPPIQIGLPMLDLSAMRKRAKEQGDIISDGVLGMWWLSNHSSVVDVDRDVLYYLDPMKRDRSLISGTWQARSVLRGGVQISKEAMKGWTLTVTSELLEFHDDAKLWSCGYRLAPLSSIPAIDLTVLSSGNNSAAKKTLLGLYEFDDSKNKLKFCVSMDGKGNRPASMESNKGSEIILIEFERNQRQ